MTAQTSGAGNFRRTATNEAMLKAVGLFMKQNGCRPGFFGELAVTLKFRDGHAEDLLTEIRGRMTPEEAKKAIA